MGIPILHLRLEGPLQSWGEHSKLYFRGTLREPTKSGVLGLIACAMGYPRYDSRIEALDPQLKMGVRVDREGLITSEFQTIDSGYITANRGFQSKGIIRTKQYLQDATFLVLLSGREKLLDTIEEALSDPQWPYYLGRKCCSPSMPLLLGRSSKYSSLEEALSKLPYICQHNIPMDARNKDGKLTLRCILEDPQGTIERTDAIRANKSRMYGIRKVREFWISLLVPDLEGTRSSVPVDEQGDMTNSSLTGVD